MGRSARLRKQRRADNECPPVADIGDGWLKVHGSNPVHIVVMPTGNYRIEWHSFGNFARLFVPSIQLDQCESVTLQTPCDSEAEVMKLHQVLQRGFGTEGRPALGSRFYCQETQRWVVPVAVNLRLFYR